MIITLSAKTKKGKDRIAQDGPDFLVLNSTETAMFCLSVDRPSVDGFKNARWVQIENDPNFTWKANDDSTQSR